ncbi:MAG: HAD family hydrolase [archaeon]
MEFEAVVFDMYGTLMHTADKSGPYDRLFRKLSFSLWWNGMDRHKVKRICMTEDLPSMSDVVHRLLPNKRGFDVSGYDSAVAKEVGSVVLYPDVLETLGRLRDKGISMGLVSNLASPYREPFFRFGLDRFISSFVFSCDVEMMKPESGIYRAVLGRMEVSAAKVLMVGDSFRNDVEAPELLGMRSVLLDRKGSSDCPRKIRSLSEISLR